MTAPLPADPALPSEALTSRRAASPDACPAGARYAPLLADPRDFPAPMTTMLARCIPASVRWGASAQQAGTGSTLTSAFTDQPLTHAQTRYALIDACKALGLVGATVIVPAFHCRSLVEPIEQAGATPLFAPMSPQLRYRLPELQQLIIEHRPRALILTHFFGFSGWSDALAQLCEQHQIVVIEDCAHALYGEVTEGAARGQALGSLGAAACSSAWKFLPLDDGASLRLASGEATKYGQAPQTGARRVKTRSQGLRAQASGGRTAVQGLIQGLLHSLLHRPPHKPPQPALAPGASHAIPPAPSSPASLSDTAAASLIAQTQAVRQRRLDRPRNPQTQAGATTLLPSLLGAQARWASQWLFKRADHEGLAQRRRAAYQRWLQGLAGCRWMRPLYPQLLPGVVPYAMPVLADAQGLAFDALRLAGVPIWRWEDLACEALQTCAVAHDYRRALLQLPCHQDLDDATLDALIATVQRVDADVLPALLDQVVLERVVG